MNDAGATPAHSAAALLPPYPESPPCDPGEETLPWIRSVDGAGPAGIDALAAGREGSLWVAASDRALRFDRTGAVSATAKAPAKETLRSIALDRKDRLYALATAQPTAVASTAEAGSAAASLDVLRFAPSGQVTARRAIEGGMLAPASAITLRPSGDSYITVTFRGKLSIEKLTLESADPSLAVIGLDADLHPVWAHAYATNPERSPEAAEAVDAAGNLLAAIPFRGTVAFGAEELKSDRADVALVTFDANGGVTRARALGLGSGSTSTAPIRLLIDKQSSAILLANGFAVKVDALGQDVYREATAGSGASGNVQTAVVTTSGEVALLQTNGEDDAGAPRLALVRLDKSGKPKALTEKDRGIATGSAGDAAMMVDRCGALTLATKSGAGFTVATHVAN